MDNGNEAKSLQDISDAVKRRPLHAAIVPLALIMYSVQAFILCVCKLAFQFALQNIKNGQAYMNRLVLSARFTGGSSQ